jgi:Sensors of blue-light using FAD
MFRQITYISTAKAPVLSSLLADIERSAQRNNARTELSGLLLFDGVRFLQVLEGTAERIAPTLAIIQTDPRHFGMVVLRDCTVETRGFPGWAMLCRDMSGKENISDLVGKYLADADKTTRALFASFAQIREHAA